MPQLHSIIIGGGVIGSACAYYLRKAGQDVTIIDKGPFAGACSHANCGLLCPSHVLPLAAPGAIGKTMKMMFRKNAPIYIKPRIDLRLWQWLIRFAMRCNERDMMAAGRARQALLQSSIALYEELFEEEGIDCEFEHLGTLFVFKTQQAMDHFGNGHEMLAREFGVEALAFDRGTTLQREPALLDDIAGAWTYPGDGHLRPDKLMSAWRAVLERMGVRIVEHNEVTTFIGEGGKAKAIKTRKEELQADHFVVATGAWSPFLNRELGCNIPIQPGKGYSMTMPRPTICPTHPLLFEEHKVAVTPMRSGYRLGSTMEFSGYDTSINEGRLQNLKEGAAMYLKEPYCDPVVERWYGWRPMTFDGIPVIDRSPRYSNIMIAAGHNMLGLSMAPATGKLVSELITGQSPHIEPRRYGLGRFR